MNKTKSNDLAKQIRHAISLDLELEPIIELWLNQNQVAVGLTDEQCYEYGNEIFQAEGLNWVGIHLIQWQKQKTFNPPIREIPVGLSRDQVRALTRFLKLEHLEADILDWLDTQTIHQPTTVSPKQVWIHKRSNTAYIIEEILVLNGETKLETWNKDLTLVVYKPANKDDSSIYRRTLTDFLSKFEQIQ